MEKNSAENLTRFFWGAADFWTVEGQLYEKTATHLRRIRKVDLHRSMRSKLTEEQSLQVSSATLTEVAKRIQADVAFEIPVEDVFHPNKINVKNGVVNLDNGELEQLSEQLFTYQADFCYIGDAVLKDAPRFAKFLEKSLPDEQKQKLLLEIFGYSISEDANAQCAMFLLGKSGTGKSVALKLISNVMGEQNVTAIPLNQLGSRFNKAQLAGTKLNVCTEVASGKFRNIDIFKAIVSGERITAENKGEDPFEFTARTKLIFAGNVFPTFPDTAGSDAMIRRIVVLRFTDSIEESERDRNLFDALYEERDVIFSLAVKALRELRERNYVFTMPEDTKNYMENLTENSDVIKNFLLCRCDIRPGKRVHCARLWNAFKRFVEEEAYDCHLNMLQFSQEIAGIAGVERKRFRENGQPPLRGFQGIGLKSVRVGIVDENTNGEISRQTQNQKKEKFKRNGAERGTQKDQDDIRQDSRVASREEEAYATEKSCNCNADR